MGSRRDLEEVPEHVRLLVAVRQLRFGGGRRSRQRFAKWLGVSYMVLYRWETSWNDDRPQEPPIYLIPWLEMLLRPEAAAEIAQRYLPDEGQEKAA